MGSAMGSYALIHPYFRLLMETNPNSFVSLETEADNQGVERFKYLFSHFKPQFKDMRICGKSW